MYKKCLFYAVLFLAIISFFFLTVPCEARNGSNAPPWFTDPDNAQGGPSWLGNPQEGIGPWFWQAYNGFDVTGIAPVWYTDTVNAECVPSWYLSGSNGPWWASYIIDGSTGEESSSRFRSTCTSCSQARNGSNAPPWFSDPDNTQGGPSWLGNPQEGVGPWFWQAYNGFDVTGIAPVWYTDTVNAECVPSWYLSGSNGPWWASYIMQTGE